MRIVRAFAELFECSDFKQLWICFSHTFSCVTHKKKDAATWNCNLKNEKTKQCIYIDALCLEYGEHMSKRGNLRCMHVFHDNGFLFCLEPTPNESVFVLPLTLSRLSYLSCLSLSLPLYGNNYLYFWVAIYISWSIYSFYRLLNVMHWAQLIFHANSHLNGFQYGRLELLIIENVCCFLTCRVQ